MATRLLPLTIAELCAHSLELERFCEVRPTDYAARMRELGEKPLALAFSRMARSLREEIVGLKEASGKHKPAELSPWEYAWRLTYMPEAVQDRPRFVPATAREALQCAVQARRRAGIFYDDVAKNAHDAEVRGYATELLSAKQAALQRLERLLAHEILESDDHGHEEQVDEQPAAAVSRH